MLPPSSDSAALVPTCPCPSALCIAPSTSQGPGDPHNQDPKGGLFSPANSSAREELGLVGHNRDPLWRSPVLKQDRGQLLGGGRGDSSSECWHPVSGLDSPRVKGETSSHERCGLWRQPPPGERSTQGGPASIGHIFLPVDLGVANVLWAFPHGAYSDPHWRSQGRQAFRAPLKASTSWVQLPEATPPGVPACLPGRQHPGLLKGSGVGRAPGLEAGSPGAVRNFSLHSPSHSEMGSKANS